jgi:hypothetical protein
MINDSVRDESISGMRQFARIALSNGASPSDLRHEINQTITQYLNKIAILDGKLPSDEPVCPECKGFGKLKK